MRDRLGVPEFKTAMYISFMHALVTGVGAYYIFWQTWTEFPLDMLKLKYFEIPGANIVITMSIGVFSSSYSDEFHLKSTFHFNSFLKRLLINTLWSVSNTPINAQKI